MPANDAEQAEVVSQVGVEELKAVGSPGAVLLGLIPRQLRR